MENKEKGQTRSEASSHASQYKRSGTLISGGARKVVASRILLPSMWQEQVPAQGCATCCFTLKPKTSRPPKAFSSPPVPSRTETKQLIPKAPQEMSVGKCTYRAPAPLVVKQEGALVQLYVETHLMGGILESTYSLSPTVHIDLRPTASILYFPNPPPLEPWLNGEKRRRVGS
jgi:hypothetical protein